MIPISRRILVVCGTLALILASSVPEATSLDARSPRPTSSASSGRATPSSPPTARRWRSSG